MGVPFLLVKTTRFAQTFFPARKGTPTTVLRTKECTYTQRESKILEIAISREYLGVG